jgi:hypothetical protein
MEGRKFLCTVEVILSAVVIVEVIQTLAMNYILLMVVKHLVCPRYME